MRPIDADALIEFCAERWIPLNVDAVNMQPTIEPSTNCSEFPNNSDCISRQAAIDALDKQIKQCCKALGSLCLSYVDKHAVEVKMASLRAYRKMLENLPTAQPERAKGEWINTNPEYKNGFYNNSYYCSECHDYYTTSPYEMKFCPNCGSDMRGERDEQDWRDD